MDDARAEIEFIAADPLGRMIPIEVKSGKRTRAKSLQSYIDKCQPCKMIKLAGKQGLSAVEQKHLVFPLYFTEQAVRRHLWEAKEVGVD